jgi:CubicO group peptidase (beta-lactamase class C family)
MALASPAAAAPFNVVQGATVTSTGAIGVISCCIFPDATVYPPAPLSSPVKTSETLSIDTYLSRNPTTGLLIARDDTILYEHYQYARTDRDRFLSQSMAKTITAMLIGIAVSEGKIKSIDDPASAYVPRPSEYGIRKDVYQRPAAHGVRRLLHRIL